MVILHLNLEAKWFDMIFSGEKKEEYREIKPYWSRVFSSNIKIKGKYYHPTDVIICFSNGYAKNRSQLYIKCEGLCVREGNSDWGAVPGQQYYVLRLSSKIALKL